jgi:ubiquitin C-terminal hydrolase
LRQEKPFVENPDSEERKVVDLGLENWSNTLRRDWSFIFFMFYGQFKSTLTCQLCQKISTTFDVFTNIPLSLPEPSKVKLNVVIYRLPNEIKDIIQGKNKLRRLDSRLSEERGASQGGERDQKNLLNFQESLKHVTND